MLIVKFAKIRRMRKISVLQYSFLYTYIRHILRSQSGVRSSSTGVATTNIQGGPKSGSLFKYVNIQ